MKTKKRFRPFRSLAVVIILLIISGLLWWGRAISPENAQSQEAQIFVIPKGQAIDTIASRLKDAGLIRSKVAFKIIVFRDGLAKKIQAGDFRLKSSMDLTTLSQELTRGTLDIWVTLLEGWRREEMASKIATEFSTRQAEFDQAIFLQATIDKEGYLFPDTYLFPRDASEQSIAQILINTFEKKVDLSSNNSGLSANQVIVLASIVEREVNTDKDRPIIAGILIKRLKNDWPLQTDATVQYFIGTNNCRGAQGECSWWPQNLTRANIDAVSSFNTYQNQGLPPTPIANPGLASINAVLDPQSSPHWFYISDLSGTIHYASDIEGHNSNIAKYLQK